MPLFPLNTVLFPGVVLPLHIFEERYRLLVRELVASNGPRRFGVVAIRSGAEVGDDEPPETYDIGCVAELRRVSPYSDGRYDIVTTGGPRFRLRETDDSRPYLQAAVDYLPDDVGELPPTLVPRLQSQFATYWDIVAATRGEDVPCPELPDDPPLLSYLVAAAIITDLPEKQELLANEDAASRLRRELWILRRECALLERWSELPDFPETRGPWSIN